MPRYKSGNLAKKNSNVYLNWKFSMKPKHFPYMLKFDRDKKQWLAQRGKITHKFRILSDYSDSAGTVEAHF
jgi:hypothetical protein